MKAFSLEYTRNPATVEICIGHEILGDRLITLCKKMGSRVALIADETVASLHGRQVLNLLSENGISAELLSFPAGEISKNRETKAWLEDQLFDRKYTRDTLIIALGGGTTTDLVGYLASTFCRGVPFLLLPTSLLAMVDASLGGKTGINVMAGKNLIGSLYHPLGIYMELDFLKSLPAKEMQNGLVEMIKHGIVLDADYFVSLEKQAFSQSLEMSQLIMQSCQIKQAVVQEDEHEQGKRRLLNFGHTIGHALEAASGYALSHGEAVALGMIAEAEIAIASGYLQGKVLQRLKQLFAALGIDPKISFPTTPAQLYGLMQNDKKSLGKTPRFVMLSQVGYAEPFAGVFCTPVDEAALFRILKRMCVCYAS